MADKGRLLTQDADDRLRRQEIGADRKRSAGRVAASVAGSVAGSVASGVKKLMVRGVRHPDDMITKGPNRSLYIASGGHPVSPVPGRAPKMDKSILVGNMSGTSNAPRLRPKSSPRRRGDNQLRNLRKRLWGK